MLRATHRRGHRRGRGDHVGISLGHGIGLIAAGPPVECVALRDAEECPHALCRRLAAHLALAAHPLADLARPLRRRLRQRRECPDHHGHDAEPQKDVEVPARAPMGARLCVQGRRVCVYNKCSTY